MPTPTSRLFVLSLIVVALSSAAYATSAARIPAFEKVDEVSIFVLLGDAIDATYQDREPLFRGVEGRSTAFLSDLKTSITISLQEAGISVADEASAGMEIKIFGHRIPGEDCALDWVFLVEVDYWECEKDECGDQGWGKVGVTSDSNLEDSIRGVIITELERELRYRESQREHEKQ